MSNQVLSCENVTASYGAIQALHGVNLEVNEGEIVVVLGANGAHSASHAVRSHVLTAMWSCCCSRTKDDPLRLGDGLGICRQKCSAVCAYGDFRQTANSGGQAYTRDVLAQRAPVPD